MPISFIRLVNFDNRCLFIFVLSFPNYKIGSNNSMFFKKINNAELWDKIQNVRELIRKTPDFKRRVCWKCGKDLNIYDFLSDNLEYDALGIFELWQNSLLEFHCCDCFKELKINDLRRIERDLKTRKCGYCNAVIDLYKFARTHNYLKIEELKEEWLHLEQPIFCNKICQRKYLKIKYSALQRSTESE